MNCKEIIFITVIVILVILSFLNVCEEDFGFTREGFSYESNCVPEDIFPNSIAKLDTHKNFMLRDIKTNFWLIIDNGIGKFVPGRFGVSFVLSSNPNEDLPLRLASQPNSYIVAGYNGDGLRAVSNPYTEFFKVEVLIYNQRNILSYLDEGSNQHFIVVDPSGYSSSTTDPDSASMFEMLFVQ